MVLSGPEDLLPEQLTERLRHVLPVGRVTAVHAGDRHPTIVSTIVSLRIEYSPDAPREAPTRLLLKATRAGLPADLQSIIGEREVAFYRHAAPHMAGNLLPRCYDAEYAAGRFHLLLEDLSETHTMVTEWPIPPTVEACEQIIDTWAAFHGFWWGHPLLGRGVGTFLGQEALVKIAAEYQGRYERFAETLGDRLASEARAIYARVAEARERVFTPARLYAAPTLAHGDAHVWNVLYPRDGAGSGIRLIDWDGWRLGYGAADLAYMMAVHWYPERRARLEARLIERYHAGLLAHGVTNYSLDRLWQDYRFSVIRSLSTPVWQQSFGLHPSIWWPHLHRVLSAFEDLDCAALLS